MILLSELKEITFDMVKDAAIVLVALYGIQVIVDNLKTKFKARVKNEQKVEDFEPETFKYDMEKYLDSKHRLITDKYDGELKEIRDEIQENHTEYVALIQEIKSELYLQTECNAVIMDGLVQLDCNGPVKEMKKRMDSFMNKRAHDVSTEEA